MLGMEISDPTGEEYGGTVQGMGLLDTKTVFRPEKHRTRVHGTFGEMKGILKEMEGLPFEGYEIHMGRRRKMSMAVMCMESLIHRKCQVGFSPLY